MIGGKLQGTEATYLAHKAGWQVVLIDKSPAPPALGMADEFHQIDVVGQASKLPEILRSADLIVPALEDGLALLSLGLAAKHDDIPLAFDEPSYRVSSSKIRSDALFVELGLPAPRLWPRLGPPLLAKPSGSSGSHGVRKIGSLEELAAFLSERKDGDDSWVVQEFLEGPSYSLEVFGSRGNFVSLQATAIEIDETYDCKRVLAPADLAPELKNDFDDLSRRIASALDLKGIMDVEVILRGRELKVLEIDARLPSQTPTAVYHSTGVNMIKLLADVFVGGSLPHFLGLDREKSVIYEHVKVAPEAIEVAGEHIMAAAGPLKLWQNFYGADEAITDFEPGKDSWVATLIHIDESPERVRARREATIQELKDHFKINAFKDPTPK